MNSVTNLRAGNLLTRQATRLLQEHPTALCRRTSKNLQEKTEARLGAGKHTRMQMVGKGKEEVLFCVRAVKTPSADKCMAGPRDKRSVVHIPSVSPLNMRPVPHAN